MVRNEIVYHSFLYYCIKTQNYQKTFDYLSQLNSSDPYVLQAKAVLFYYYVIDSRERTKESVDFMKRSSILCRELINQNP